VKKRKLFNARCEFNNSSKVVISQKVPVEIKKCDRFVAS
jgi:hypothetical protein